VEARGNALEKLQAENEALVDDYNALRGRADAAGAEAAQQLAGLERQLAEARQRGGGGAAPFDPHETPVSAPHALAPAPISACSPQQGLCMQADS
jgi:septal ring factor EnvC (AmiA/AmiB activator)